MYLREVFIKNFRSLKDIHMTLNESTFLIGENNSGKTSFLDALRYALTRSIGKNIFDEYDYFMNEDMISPKDSEGIEITLIFQERIAEEWNGYILDNYGELLQYICNQTELASIIVRVTSSFNIATGEFEGKTAFLNKEYNEIIGRAQNKITSFYKLTPLFYLQALRDIKDTFSAKSPLWGRFLKKANIPNDKLKEVQDSIEILNKEIVDTDVNLTKLVNSLEDIQRILDFQGGDLVSINALPIKSWDLLSKAQLVLNNNSNNTSFPLERHGQGTQSVTTILLFKAYIDILLEEMNSSEAEAILTLEEPEAHLHPQAIRAVEKVVRETNCQKIITTHSPYFLQNIDLKDMRFFKKRNGITEIRKIYDKIDISLNTVTEGLKKVVANYTEDLELDENNKVLVIKRPIQDQLERCVLGCCKEENISEYLASSKKIFSKEELYDLNTFVQKTRGELLFARKWIMYEGQTEDVIIPFCAELLGYNLDDHGISGITYRQNGSAKAFVKLAKVLEIDWIILADNDDQGASTKREVENCGYTDEEVNNKVVLTNEKDIEHEFVKAGFLEDYEIAVAEILNEEVKKLKDEGKVQEYENAIIDIIQKGKVEYAYKLVEVWKNRNITKEEIPEFVKNFIEGVCAYERG